eukprot:COSAG05_NODE_2614_length_2835_cov_2.941155_2_plen_140_part_00
MAVLLLVGSATYLGVGIAYGRRQGRGGAGLRAHTHYPQMVTLHGLVLDGVAMVRGRKLPTRGYVEAPDGGGRGNKHQLRQAAGSATGRTKEKKKEKKKKKDKAKQGTSATQGDTDDGDGGGSPAVEVVGTAAGGGAWCM